MIVAFDSSVDMACMNCSQTPLGNHFFFMTGNRTLAFGHRRYSRPTLASAGLFVMCFILTSKIFALWHGRLFSYRHSPDSTMKHYMLHYALYLTHP